VGIDRRRLQLLLRAAALAFVLAWLLSRELQQRVPFWAPFAILLALEAEFLVRARREGREAPAGAQAASERRAPGADDADLGWGTLLESEDGVRYVPPPARPPRPRARRLATAAGVALAVVLFALALRVDSSRTWQALPADVRAQVERRLSREASTIAGRPVTVRCDDGYAYTGAGSDALGVAFIPRGLAFLHPSACRTLHDVLQGEAATDGETGESILVLAHEAVHLAGERDEAVTECKGLQEGVPLGERLGLSADHAARVMEAQWRRDLSDRSVQRLAYRLPAACRDGGALDLRPGDTTFP
jgi:hypothetical protein